MNQPSEREQAFKEKILGEYAAILLDVNKVRQVLESLSIDTYDWIDSPIVKRKIEELASAEYYAGGSDKAVAIINNLSDIELKQRIKDLVQKDIGLGIKIIAAEEKKND